jgi:hypothetical protein
MNGMRCRTGPKISTTFDSREKVLGGNMATKKKATKKAAKKKK